MREALELALARAHVGLDEAMLEAMLGGQLMF